MLVSITLSSPLQSTSSSLAAIRIPIAEDTWLTLTGMDLLISISFGVTFGILAGLRAGRRDRKKAPHTMPAPNPRNQPKPRGWAAWAWNVALFLPFLLFLWLVVDLIEVFAGRITFQDFTTAYADPLPLFYQNMVKILLIMTAAHAVVSLLPVLGTFRICRRRGSSVSSGPAGSR